MQDAAFTAMDLDASGQPSLAALYLDIYTEQTGDWEGLAVLPLHLSRHAYVRAKVHSLLAEQAQDNAERGRALAKASDYYHLAWQYSLPRRGRLILVSGLPGSGKSTISRRLVKELTVAQASLNSGRERAAHIRSDAVRKHLAGIALDSRGGAEIYTPEMTQRTYARLLELGVTLARQGVTVILDATYSRQAHRQAVIQGAQAAGIPLEIVHCHAPPELLRARLAERRGDVSDATSDLLSDSQANFEPSAEMEDARIFRIDTSRPISSETLAPVLMRSF